MKRDYLSGYDSPYVESYRIIPESGFAVSDNESGSSLEDVGDETIDEWM